MTFMPWSSALVLGVPSIDAQHHTLVDLLNTLYDEISHATPNRDTIAQVLEGLLDYTHNHFIEEEVMFLKYNYPQTQEHQAEHSHFTGLVQTWLLRFEQGEDVNLEVLAFLKNWLSEHICKQDRAYLPFMRQAMAAERAAIMAVHERKA